jgi:endo-1,4-beta-xylanase
VIAGCSGTSPNPAPFLGGSSGVGGSTATGGSPSGATGGNSSGAQGGGVSAAGTGGVAGAGGHVVATGGAPSMGGAKTAGAAGTGGTAATGGTMPSGGMSGASGAPLGGSSGAGGRPGAGGAPFGGRSGTGGAAGTGGTPGAAGAAGAAICPAGTHSTTGTQHCGASDSGTADGGYTYNIYSSGQGTGCMTVFGVDATFSATWSNVGDWIARAGLSFDSTKTPDQIGTFSSDFAYTTTGITTNGFGNVGIYGWSKNPLHEYYIIENWLGKRPNFTAMGSFTIDGEGTYDIQTNMQKDQPNITGTNADFVQFWSVRQTPRECGHISISKHFAQWASLGMQLGNLEEARILVEAQNNSGTIDFTTGTVVVTK